MAIWRALTVQAGIRTQIKAPDVLSVGAGVTTDAGNLFLSAAGGFIQPDGTKTWNPTAGAGGVDFSLMSGGFKTTTGPVLIGPSPVTVSGATDFTAAGTAVHVDNDATVGGTLTTPAVDRAGGSISFGLNTTSQSFGKVGTLATFLGNVQVNGTEAVVGASTFTGAETFNGLATFNAGIAAGGAAAIDFSGSTGAFKTSTGASTFGGSLNTFTNLANFLSDVDIEGNLNVDGTITAGGNLLHPSAVVFSPTPDTPTTSIISARSANQSPITGAVVGATNFGSDTSGATTGVSANYASVLGGDQCTAEAAQAVSCGGFQTKAQGTNSFVGSGIGTRAFGPSSGAVCGSTNLTIGGNSFIGGGNGNQTFGVNSCIPGGDGNTTNNTGSFIPGGQNCTTNGLNSGAMGDHCQTLGGARGGMAMGVAAISTRTGQAVVACGPLGPIAPQTTLPMTFRANTPGALANESAELKYGVTNPASERFVLENNKGYRITVTLLVLRNDGLTRTLRQTFSVHTGVGTITIDGSSVLETFGAAALVATTFTVTPAGSVFAIVYTNGLVPFVTDAEATVEFAETQTGANL
jgi:hypothetical protein